MTKEMSPDPCARKVWGINEFDGAIHQPTHLEPRFLGSDKLSGNWYSKNSNFRKNSQKLLFFWKRLRSLITHTFPDLFQNRPVAVVRY
ncbi:hypothetical protein [Vibrio albus]|uniref:hypothetical protein n=1 Tax=Vibrio albus TaxID=2200953 RepID=UPI0011B23685|nr:hypothetical protein [Vibrio albus]